MGDLDELVEKISRWVGEHRASTSAGAGIAGTLAGAVLAYLTDNQISAEELPLIAGIGAASAGAGYVISWGLDTYNQMQDTFHALARHTHHLKNTAGVVGGYAQMIQADPDAAEKVSGTLADAANNLAHSIGDLGQVLALRDSDYVRREEAISLNETLGGYINGFDAQRKFLGKEEITSQYFGLPEGKDTIHTDPNMLQVALGNLFTNAARHAGKYLDVSARITEEGGRQYLDITLENDIGEQGTSMAGIHGRIPSTGIGIPQSKEILGQNGGYLDVKTDGRVFKATVQLPYDSAQ